MRIRKQRKILDRWHTMLSGSLPTKSMRINCGKPGVSTPERSEKSIWVPPLKKLKRAWYQLWLPWPIILFFVYTRDFLSYIIPHIIRYRKLRKPKYGLETTEVLSAVLEEEYGKNIAITIFIALKYLLDCLQRISRWTHVVIFVDNYWILML